MLVEQIVLKSGSEDVATLNEISLGKAMGRVPGPKLILVERGNVNTTGHEHRSGHLGNGLEGTLNSIKNRLENSRTELDGKGLVGTENGVTNSETGSIFVALDRGSVAFQLDDLSDQLIPSNLNCLVHLGSAHVVGHDKGTSNFVDAAVFGLLVFEVINHLYSVCLFYLCRVKCYLRSCF